MYLTLRDRPGGKSAASSAAPRIATTVVLLGIVSLLTDISSEMVNAVLPLYLTAEVGLGVLAYGFVDGLYQGVSALLRIGGGYVGDRSNRPKWVAAVGYGLSALSRVGMLVAHNLAAISAVVTADRLGKGLRTAPRDAMIADSSDPRALGRSFGVHRTLDTIGAAIGPMVAFSMLLLVPGDYNSVWVVSAGFAFVGVAVIVLFVPNRKTKAVRAGQSFRHLLRQVTGPRLRRPLIAAGLLALFTVGDGFLYLSLQQRDHMAAKYFPLLYVGSNISYLLLAIPFGRLADRIGRTRVFLGGHVALLAVYLFAAGPFGGAWSTVLVLGLLGTYYAATDGVLPALVTPLVDAHARGSGIAAAQTVVVLARFASSLAFGSLWLLLGSTHALFLVGGLLLATLALSVWLLRGSEATPAAEESESEVTA
ncbi:MFS transporter [Dactylosporangium sp. CS-033363]|uniref:MFS transporter n=1 Tax=Dactylosporangium sp. CS-033363 TaxID=3239935 RepID=UPI003D92C599